ncbi:hypothetical protein [Caballeronia novacaledonica]|uniref:hypothetical protein n=1 Tax=Caballeronia novacaledonica TaxID=1544861 RepID=UPI001EE1E40B|nr:hypothetical protein [Caballeronia novacaledonica]
MLIERGVLQSIEIEYARERRYAQRRQTSSHRAPRYRVCYRLDNRAERAIMAIAPFPRYLIAELRGSQPGDEIEAWLSDDGASLIDWKNLSVRRLLEKTGRTWDVSD